MTAAHADQHADGPAVEHAQARPKSLTSSDVQCPEALLVDAVRRRLGWTYARLGGAAGVSLDMAAKWCRTDRPNVPNLKHLLKLVAAEPEFAKLLQPGTAPRVADVSLELHVLNREVGELSGVYIETAPNGRTAEEWLAVAREAGDVERKGGDLRKLAEAKAAGG
jgi:transcriptional regulator with XRE-family HTH domain